MKDKWENERNMLIDLPAGRVFSVVKNDNVDIIIANKSFTKFRTLDQLLAMEGETVINTIKDKGLFGRIYKTYTLPSGQLLRCATEDREDEIGYVQPFTSIADLKEYEEECKKSYEEYLKHEERNKQIKESEYNEKYLEF